jgi:hypothetical protein
VSTRAPDLVEARRALSVLADPAHGVQLQSAPYWHFATFGGEDLDGACDWVAKQGNATGVYYALNPVPPDLGHRVLVGDVYFRRWLLVDVDRSKLAGKELSATDSEHEAARELALDVRNYLDERGWPAPVLVDSGNGYHLLYRLDLPNDPDSRQLIHNALKHLAARFNGDKGEVGDECFDARRVAKLPGTWARRGIENPERPHRMCRLLHVPEAIETVSEDLLRALSETGKLVSVSESTPVPGVDVFRLRATGNGEAAYARAALERECGRMALTEAGKLNVQLFKSAAALGNFVGSKLLDEQQVFDGLLAAARAAGADNPRKDQDTLRRGLEEGKKTPRGAPKKEARTAPAVDPPQVKKPLWYKLPHLLAMDLPEPRWAVPGLMSEGLTILAGKPKLGKSFMALNLALTIAAGGLALGETRVVPGDVLYLSLEDRLRRLQDRARKLLKGIQCEASAKLSLAVEWQRADRDGLSHIEEWVRSVERPSLVIVDVWAKFRPAYTQGSQYDQDYQWAATAKQLGDQHGCSFLALHHCKKAAAEDVVDEISGTLGLAGAADGLLILTRSRSENEANLFITGRDVEERELALQFDTGTFVWSCLGSAKERTDSKTKSGVIGVLKANTGLLLGISEIAAALQLDEKQKPYLRNVLARMVSDGLIDRQGQGRYRWPVNEIPL